MLIIPQQSLKERFAIDGGSFRRTLHGQSIKENSMSAISLNNAPV
jgi:hypothetical protein